MKKYQVFVSSTFVDLMEERQEVIKALLELDCIPVGFELSAGDDEDQWSLIRSTIADCDYYLLIIGNKYESLHSSGLSYTEMEYQYAFDRGIPIIGFLHKNPEILSINKSETDTEKIQKLNKFKSEIQKRKVLYWESSVDLGAKISRSFVQLIKTHPSSGWVKADGVANEDALIKILKLSDEVDSQYKIIKKLEKNEMLYKDLIRNNIRIFSKIIKDTKNALYNEMFRAVELSFNYSTDNLNAILDDSLQIISDSLLEIIHNQIRMKDEDGEVSVSIKTFVNGRSAKKISYNQIDGPSELNSKNDHEMFILTLARDSKTLENRPDREIRKRFYKVGKNSDFNRILAGDEFFISNDLKLESEEFGYVNESKNWQDNYNALAVVPIYYLPKEDDNRQIFGFLTVDALNKKGFKIFTRKDTIPILEFGAELLTIVFLNLGLYETIINDKL